MSLKPRPNLTLVAIWLFVAITAVKLGIYLFLVHNGSVAPFVGDNSADHYVPTARRLLNEGRFNGPDSRLNSTIAPLYSGVLAGFMAVAPGSYLVAITCFQMMADLATALVLLWLAKKYLRPAVGLLAGAIWLLYPPEVAISTWVTAETLFTLLVTGSIAVYLSSLEHSSASRSLLAGCALGATTLARATTILLPLLLILPLLWMRSFRRATCVVVAYLIMIAPWAIRNRIVLDDPILVSVGFGAAFLQGSDERLFTIEGKRQYYPEVHADAVRDGILKPSSDHESQIDRWLFRVGLNAYRQRLAQRPLSIIPFESKKFLRLWYATESAGWKGQFVLGFCSLLLAVPGFWQLWKWDPRRSQLAWAGAITIVYFSLLYWVAIPINRYMVPVYPILALAAADWCLGCWRTRPAKTSSLVTQIVS
jgi:4-amino-4-deoxy-L-arabinose transferase-like glycosyltransferase